MHSKRTAGPPLLAGKALPQSQLLTWLAKASAHYHSDEADPKAPGIVRYRPVAFNSVLQFSSGKGKSNSTNSQIVTNTCTRVWCCNGFDVVSIAASMSQPRCQGRNEEAKDRHRGMSFRNLKRQEKESAKRSSGLFFSTRNSGQQTQYNGTNKHQTLSIV